MMEITLATTTLTDGSKVYNLVIKNESGQVINFDLTAQNENEAMAQAEKFNDAIAETTNDTVKFSTYEL